MNARINLIATLVSTCVVVGCVSLDATRAQLSSSDSAEVKKAEQNILTIVKTGKDSSGFMNFDTSEQVEYVKLVSDNDLLLQIMEQSYREEVIQAAADRLDLTKPGTGMMIFESHKKAIEHASASSAEKIIDSLSEEEICNLLGIGEDEEISEDLNYRLKEQIARKLFEKTRNVDILISFYDGKLRTYLKGNERFVAISKIAENIKDVKEAAMAIKVLDANFGAGYPCVKDPMVRAQLLAKLPENELVKYVENSLRNHYTDYWNKNDLLPLEEAIEASKLVAEKTRVVYILNLVLSKIMFYKNECEKSWIWNWDQSDVDKANSLIRRFPKLDADTFTKLLRANESSYQYLMDNVTPEIAYDILKEGTTESEELEFSLVGKLTSDKIDVAMYENLTYIASRNLARSLASAENKEVLTKLDNEEISLIMEMAEVADKETFAMKGFYLGMSILHASRLLASYFPDMEIKIMREDNESNGNLVIKIDAQGDYFCFASKDDGKVYRFNFGKKVLKKWFNYDVQTPGEWARAFGREMKMDMRYKHIQEDTRVYEPMGTGSYLMVLNQDTYQYKHNEKEYRAIYFGEEKEWSWHGGIGGDIIKAQGAYQLRYVRGDEGTLRIKYERD